MSFKKKKTNFAKNKISKEMNILPDLNKKPQFII